MGVPPISSKILFAILGLVTTSVVVLNKADLDTAEADAVLGKLAKASAELPSARMAEARTTVANFIVKSYIKDGLEKTRKKTL
jgi:hypothetical protein